MRPKYNRREAPNKRASDSLTASEGAAHTEAAKDTGEIVSLANAMQGQSYIQKRMLL